MKSIKNIMFFLSLMLFVASINNVYADRCSVNMEGKIKSIKIDDNGRHFYASFGEYDDVIFWNHLKSDEGKGAFALLRIALLSVAHIQVTYCSDNGAIVAFKVKAVG
ncbi:conserved exported hypothetical protein [Xenorhabdus bovienii str. puntauvense]|uniref:Uncharacterized protein n=1 Tax=Xenorhabdus bovienii str. puntauvense TaxID=1398201 RepID=A0A077NAJ8_XENBV|nr:hypothetical protein [Xenorhabdus bovienii]CDG95268.1 conserved exported hypothetical protein [Xenorhabdus bovienii str. puntauvense]